MDSDTERDSFIEIGHHRQASPWERVESGRSLKPCKGQEMTAQICSEEDGEKLRVKRGESEK